jgi:hypothetical protein
MVRQVFDLLGGALAIQGFEHLHWVGMQGPPSLV